VFANVHSDNTAVVEPLLSGDCSLSGLASKAQNDLARLWIDRL
jgi:hypothetical protein